MSKLVNIGKSVKIKGELSGKEDLTIEGKVDGKIVLKDHSLTIGENGRIRAEIHAKSVVIIGEVIGNITADDLVEVATSGSLHGDICAPRVVLADGCCFKGSVDMKPGSTNGASASTGATASTAAKATASATPPTGDRRRSETATPV